MNNTIIRPITPADNQAIAKVIRTVLIELGVPKVGTAYEDVSLDQMYETYLPDQMEYYVVEHDGAIIGGAGIGPLDGGDKTVCELQKMYFLDQARGKGIGTAMINTCMAYAKAQGFKRCYLETMPYMNAAQKLYKKTGFTPLEAPLGDTGHYSCTVWMIKEL